MIIAPNRVRADQIVNVAVSVYRLYFSSLTIRAAIRREDFEYASVTEKFTIPSTKLLQMWVRYFLLMLFKMSGAQFSRSPLLLQDPATNNLL